MEQGRVEAHMTERISVVGWTAVPSDSEITTLDGAVLNVMVGAAIGPTPTALGEYFRFARVRVDAISEQPTTCARCESRARWRIDVQWEAGYVSPDGDILCESCIDGLVTAGTHLIAFWRKHATARATSV